MRRKEYTYILLLNIYSSYISACSVKFSLGFTFWGKV